MKTLLYALILTLTVCPAYGREANGIESDTLIKTSTSWNGDSLPAYPQGEPEITILRITIPPKTALPWHRHPFINAGVLLSGQLTVVTESGKTLHMKPGEPLVEVVNTWHHGVNDGDVPAEILVFYAGVKGMPVSVKRP